MAIHAFSAHPITRKTAIPFRQSLAPSLKRNSQTFEFTVQRGNLQYLLAVAEHYKLEAGKWTPAARFLLRCLIHALDLEDHENFILWAAIPKRGRPQRTDLAERIWHERQQGKTIAQIEKTLKRDGLNEDVTRETIRDYLKPRRRDLKKSKLSRRGKLD